MKVSNKGSIEAAWKQYGIKEPELLDDALVERMWQAYRATDPKPKISDFMRQIKHIEQHGAERVITHSQPDSVFIGIVMTTMNRLSESQGLPLADISYKESLASDGVQSIYEHHIDAVPEHFSDVIGLLVRQRTRDCALSGTAQDRVVRTNPAVPVTAETLGVSIH